MSDEDDHKEIFGRLDKLSETLVEVATTQKLTNTAMKENFNLINQKLDKQNGRVRELETECKQHCTYITEHKIEHRELRKVVAGISTIAALIGAGVIKITEIFGR